MLQGLFGVYTTQWAIRERSGSDADVLDTLRLHERQAGECSLRDCLCVARSDFSNVVLPSLEMSRDVHGIQNFVRLQRDAFVAEMEVAVGQCALAAYAQQGYGGIVRK